MLKNYYKQKSNLAFKKHIDFKELPKSLNLCGKLGNCVSPKTSDESVFCIVRQTRCAFFLSLLQNRMAD